MAKPTHGLRVTRNTDAMTVTFELVNKLTESVEDSLTVNWADVDESQQPMTSLYGLSKFCMDRESAIAMEHKLGAFQELLEDTLFKGDWDRPRKSSGPTVRIEVEALARLKKMTVKQAQTLLRKYSKEDQESILASEKVTAQVAEMQADQTEASEDAFDDLI